METFRKNENNHDAWHGPLSRRDFLAAGLALGPTVSMSSALAALSVAAPAAAESTPPASAVALNKKLFPEFEQRFIRTEGPPLMLIHGYPENHLCWHKIAADLSKRYTLVLPDLRGYGDSSKPGTSPQHVNYAKSAMAADMMQVMRTLGFERFQAVGHDRGGRVLQSMMMDGPELVTRGVMLDIVPSDLMYESMNKDLGTRYFWWFFHIQKEPLPENFINALPEYYVRSHFGIQNRSESTVPPELMSRTSALGPGSTAAFCRRTGMQVGRSGSRY
jgi:haloacetate dehalogenase